MRPAFDSPVSRRTRTLLILSVLVSTASFTAALLTRQWLALALIWNLGLAWVPYVLARWIRRLADRSEHGTGLLVLPTALWLLFFPNAPYIVTDLIHLRNLGPDLVVPGAVLISSIAALALTLGLHSLRDVHGVVHERLGSRWGHGFAATVCVLSALGVWMGRVLRWNSWDALTHPLDVVTTSLSQFAADPQAQAYVLGSGAALFVLYRLVLVQPGGPATRGQTLPR